MARGFYSAASAMMAEMTRFESISHNLANVNTRGYKRNQTVHHDFQQSMVSRIQANGQAGTHIYREAAVPIGSLGTGTLIQHSWNDFRNGNLQETGNPFDLALQGDGFFVLSTPEGDRYTRNGAFQRDQQGFLVSAEGYRLLGERGPIRLVDAKSSQIGSDGRVSSNGQFVDRLALVRFDHPQGLQNQGEGLYRALPDMPEQDSQASLYVGHLEQSNVELASEMVNMISALRAYQASQKALQSEDEMTGRLISDVGRP